MARLVHLTQNAFRVTAKLTALWALQPGTRPNAGVSPHARAWRGLRGAQRMSRAKSVTAKVEMARPFETRSKRRVSNPEGTSG